MLVNVALEKSRHPDEKAAYDDKIDELDVATEQADELDQTADDDEGAVEQLTEEARARTTSKRPKPTPKRRRQEADDASDARRRDLTTKLEDIQGELVPNVGDS